MPVSSPANKRLLFHRLQARLPPMKQPIRQAAAVVCTAASGFSTPAETATDPSKITINSIPSARRAPSTSTAICWPRLWLRPGSVLRIKAPLSTWSLNHMQKGCLSCLGSSRITQRPCSSSCSSSPQRRQRHSSWPRQQRQRRCCWWTEPTWQTRCGHGQRRSR